MNYCDLNEYEDYIENIEFFLKETKYKFLIIFLYFLKCS